jgi:hypothetical protein
MPNEANALSKKPGAPGQGYYRAGGAALSRAARAHGVGNADATRSRQAVTRMLLAAIERLESEVANGSDAGARYGRELSHLLEAIRMARPAWGADSDLAALLRLLERRIDAMVTPGASAPAVGLAAPRAAETAEKTPPPGAADELAAPSDPLAQIMALSEEERLALFT